MLPVQFNSHIKPIGLEPLSPSKGSHVLSISPLHLLATSTINANYYFEWLHQFIDRVLTNLNLDKSAAKQVFSEQSFDAEFGQIHFEVNGPLRSPIESIQESAAPSPEIAPEPSNISPNPKVNLDPEEEAFVLKGKDRLNKALDQLSDRPQQWVVQSFRSSIGKIQTEADYFKELTSLLRSLMDYDEPDTQNALVELFIEYIESDRFYNTREVHYFNSDMMDLILKFYKHCNKPASEKALNSLTVRLEKVSSTLKEQGFSFVPYSQLSLAIIYAKKQIYEAAFQIIFRGEVERETLFHLLKNPTTHAAIYDDAPLAQYIEKHFSFIEFEQLFLRPGSFFELMIYNGSYRCMTWLLEALIEHYETLSPNTLLDLFSTLLVATDWVIQNQDFFSDQGELGPIDFSEDQLNYLLKVFENFKSFFFAFEFTKQHLTDQDLTLFMRLMSFFRLLFPNDANLRDLDLFMNSKRPLNDLAEKSMPKKPRRDPS